jgi:hypothetical protein
MWQDWVNGFIGVWLILLATFAVAGNTLVFIAGLAIAILGFWGAARNRTTDELPHRRDVGGLYSE